MVDNNMTKMWSFGDQRVFQEKNNRGSYLRDTMAKIFLEGMKMEKETQKNRARKR